MPARIDQRSARSQSIVGGWGSVRLRGSSVTWPTAREPAGICAHAGAGSNDDLPDETGRHRRHHELDVVVQRREPLVLIGRHLVPAAARTLRIGDHLLGRYRLAVRLAGLDEAPLPLELPHVARAVELDADRDEVRVVLAALAVHEHAVLGPPAWLPLRSIGVHCTTPCFSLRPIRKWKPLPAPRLVVIACTSASNSSSSIEVAWSTITNGEIGPPMRPGCAGRCVA
jgi:hypothetical protein